MYVKLFSSILTSSIWSQDPNIRLVWITMLAMADAEGYVMAAPSGLARVANVPLKDCQEALKVFQEPDDESFTRDHEGRRIERLEGGWLLLNYEKYREIRTEKQLKAAARQRRRYHSKKGEVSETSQDLTPSYIEAEAEAEAYVLFDLFWKAYPRRAGSNPKAAALKAWSASKIPLSVLLEGATRYAAFCAATNKTGTEYVKQAVSWLSPGFEGWAQDWSTGEQPRRELKELPDPRREPRELPDPLNEEGR